MSAPLSKPLTLEEFLAWERRQELRYEFDGHRIVAMTGGTVNHAVITDNVVAALPSSTTSCWNRREDYGSIFPGFMIPIGSSAALIRRINSSSAPPRQSGIM